MDPLRGTTFEDDVSTLAFGGGEGGGGGGGLLVAATWGGDAKVFDATGKKYVGTFFPVGGASRKDGAIAVKARFWTRRFNPGVEKETARARSAR